MSDNFFYFFLLVFYYDLRHLRFNRADCVDLLLFLGWCLLFFLLWRLLLCSILQRDTIFLNFCSWSLDLCRGHRWFDSGSRIFIGTMLNWKHCLLVLTQGWGLSFSWLLFLQALCNFEDTLQVFYLVFVAHADRSNLCVHVDLESTYVLWDHFGLHSSEFLRKLFSLHCCIVSVHNLCVILTCLLKVCLLQTWFLFLKMTL